MEEEDDVPQVTVLVDLTVLPHYLLKPDFSFQKDFRFNLKVGDFQYIAVVQECEPPLKVGQDGLVKIECVVPRSHVQFFEIGSYVMVLAGTRHPIGEGTLKEIASIS